MDVSVLVGECIMIEKAPHYGKIKMHRKLYRFDESTSSGLVVAR
jgi:hypothetical protein